MDRQLAVFSAVLMAAYLLDIAFLHKLDFVASVVLKATPIVLLAFAVLASSNAQNPLFSQYCKYVGIGLLFCSAGDVFMDIQGLDKAYFLPGLGSFLVGHILYVVAFSVGVAWTTFTAKGLPFFICGAAMFAFLYPSLPSDFIAPVLVYVTAISCMATKALGRSSAHFTAVGLTLAFVGAVSFMVSDAVLSYSLFKSPFAGDHVVVMVTYYGGQLLIALSACGSLSGKEVKKSA